MLIPQTAKCHMIQKQALKPGAKKKPINENTQILGFVFFHPSSFSEDPCWTLVFIWVLHVSYMLTTALWRCSWAWGGDRSSGSRSLGWSLQPLNYSFKITGESVSLHTLIFFSFSAMSEENTSLQTVMQPSALEGSDQRNRGVQSAFSLPFNTLSPSYRSVTNLPARADVIFLPPPPLSPPPPPTPHVYRPPSSWRSMPGLWRLQQKL